MPYFAIFFLYGNYVGILGFFQSNLKIGFSILIFVFPFMVYNKVRFFERNNYDIVGN